MRNILLQQHYCCYASMLFRLSRRWKSKSYSNSLNLPKTAFPLSMKAGIVPKREANIRKACKFSSLYKWQSSQNRDKTFVLHDGPPYANGNLHVGHALNKIYKDITNRYKLLQGYQVHYRPGWDCHGMPIEQKALADLRLDHTSLEPMEIRQKARRFAEKTITQHRKAFERWGIMANWESDYYKTLDKHFESAELEVFYQLYHKGLIYQDFMPVYWSPSSRSALAEAELEYKEDHHSTAIYCKFAMKCISEDLLSLIGDRTQCMYVLIWTTTPWTVPCNQAVCYGNNLKYSIVKRSSTSEVFLICADFVEKLKTLLNDDITVLATTSGHSLEGCTYTHPLWPERELPLLHANHVHKDIGTGLVHTAPAHGPEDFQVAVKHNLSVECHVSESGVYTDSMPESLAGKLVTHEGNTAALDLLCEHIVHREEYVHSYPHDWRTKQPIIYRASKQWFVDTAKIKSKALACLNEVDITPAKSGRGMMSQLDLRTYWCISRQRVWGIPIPVFHNKRTNEILLTRHSIEHMKRLFEQHGSDCWWTMSIDELLPKHIIEKSGHDPEDVYERGRDILDIWFDSGSSWSSVLKDSGCQADVYLEGLDQFGGWFQSSLLTSVAVNEQAPYRCLVVHGFTVDEEGKKMSKSLGNVVDPNVVINGSKEQSSPAYGTDVLRWWAAQADLDPVVHLGPSVLERCHQQVFKIRKSLRYLLGNLHDFGCNEDAVQTTDLLVPDTHMLHLLHQLVLQVTEAYEKYNYARVVNLVGKFTTDMSSNYCHVTKHRMYCLSASHTERRACQTVQHNLLSTLTKLLAPIIPHMVEELFQYSPLNQENDSVFKSQWPSAPQHWHCPSVCPSMEAAFNVRDTFFQAISSMKPVQFDVVVCCSGEMYKQLKVLQPKEITANDSSLTEIMQCSQMSLLSRCPPVIPEDSQQVDATYTFTNSDGKEESSKFMLVILPAEKSLCPRCRRHTAEKDNKPCAGCVDALATGWES